MSEKSKRRSVFVAASQQGGSLLWQPAADVYRTRTGWLVKFELAGVTNDDIALKVQGRRLTLAGVRRDWMLEECSSHYSMEISYNRFERVIELPCDLEHARLDLEFRNGILLVRVTTEGGLS